MDEEEATHVGLRVHHINVPVRKHMNIADHSFFVEMCRLYIVTFVRLKPKVQ